MEMIKKIRKVYIKFFQVFAQKQKNPPPIVFFLLFSYFHIFKHQHTLANIYLLSIFPFTIFASVHYNFMFMTAEFLKLPSFYVASIIFLLTLAIGCNQKWKIFIFLFNVGDSLSRTQNFRSVYLFLASSIFCYEIYNSFTCRTLSDNRKYFTGFFAIAVFGAIEFLEINQSMNVSDSIEALLIVVSALYAYHLFGQKLQKISKMNINHIKDSRILTFYLTEFKEEVRTQYIKESKFLIHKRDCNNIHCFCNNEEILGKKNIFLRQLYENSIKKFPQSCDTLLYQHYIDFLLQNQLVLNALHFLKKWNHTSHLSFIAKLKCIYKIKKMLADLNSSSLYDKEYKYALEYDHLLLNLTMEIYEVLELKLNFWHEAAKETPMMITLQQEGLKIVDRMYSLNNFYNQVIKKYEKKLYSFDATILYAMYLLSTTNFKQYAELIIKNTSKILEQVQILQNNSSQTYAIRTVIKQQRFYYIKDAQTQLDYIKNKKIEKDIQNKAPIFKLIIDNASDSFCKLVKVNKEHLIGEELNILIPDGYKQVHKEQLLKILNFQNEQLGDITSSKVLHKNSKLPMKVGINQLIMSNISIKTMVDITEGSTFISIVKKMNDKTINALITFDGTLSERQEGFKQEVLLHSQFKKYVEIFIDRWNQERIIRQQRFNVMINAINFCIIINSPLSASFLQDPQLLRNGNPPIHIEIVNESSAKPKGIHVNTHQKLVKEIRHMENAFNHDSQSSTSSKNSTSAINILSNFSEKDTVPIYRRIIIGFIFVITCCLIVSMVGFLVCNIQWDNSTISLNNPLNDTMNFLKMQHLTANILLNLWDIQEYQSNPNLNQSEINNYLNPKSTFLKSAHQIFKVKFTQFKVSLYSCLRNPSNILSSEINKRFGTQLTITNYNVIPSSISFQKQNISFQSLLINYLDDFNLMSKNIYDSTLILPITYSEDVINLQNSTAFSQIIDASIDSSLNTCLILAICMNILIVLLLIPMFFVLRSRLPMHEKIFDLFASIESEMVIREIKSLTYINNIIRNYGESSEILKANVLQYQENTIYPKRGTSRKSSVTNQIVIGLQKFDLPEQYSPPSSRNQRLRGKETDRSSNMKSTTKRKSHIANYGGMKQYIEMKKTLEKRKRAGDLEFTGSQSDPKMWINKKHIIIYIMTIVFIVFLSLEVTATQTYGQQMKKRKNNLINVLSIYTSNELSFLLGKLYLRNGNAGLININPIYGLQYLQSIVQSIPTYDYTNYYGYDFVYQNCSTIKNGSSTYSKTVCMYNYSYLTLLGEFGTIFKQLFESRYNADLNYNNYVAKNQTNIYQQIVNNISAKVFYLQSVDNQLENIVYNIADFVYLDMLTYSQSINYYKLAIFIGSVCWWFFTVIVGITIILKMKKQYFKQVYMLTFLNSEMIMNNKRVQSFLDSINKTSSN